MPASLLNRRTSESGEVVPNGSYNKRAVFGGSESKHAATAVDVETANGKFDGRIQEDSHGTIFSRVLEHPKSGNSCASRATFCWQSTIW